ncbi:MAG: twin-arginine translocation signal domain-containing protein, partial [Anaerolineaceae bacterium]|nr:twin-arginine translocation signal domain-containing protein [Anaerolineaceae bacterium]
MDKDYQSLKIDRSEITPKSLYLSRRDFMRSAALAAGAVALAACAPGVTESIGGTPATADPANNYIDELGNPANSIQQTTNY